MTQKGVGVARVVNTRWSKALAVFQLGTNTSFKSPLECREDSKIPDSKELELLYVLRVAWTARRSNQSILKEVSPDCSLEGLILKLKLQ